nr:6-pyruvoyl tetrahydropterin synthase, PTPS=N-terminus of minor isoform [salmon, liver, Peptide Partial, 11 aa] [Oncorhynchus sp.]
AQADATANEVA